MNSDSDEYYSGKKNKILQLVFFSPFGCKFSCTSIEWRAYVEKFLKAQMIGIYYGDNSRTWTLNYQV